MMSGLLPRSVTSMSWPSNLPEVDGESPDERDRASDHAEAVLNWRHRFGESDARAGIIMEDDFEPFSQMNDMFTRAFGDEAVRSDDTDAFFASYRTESAPRRGDGFGLKDFALRNAAWAVSDMISDRGAERGEREGFQAPMRSNATVGSEPLQVDDSEAFTNELKAVARVFGADLAGVTEVDERWHYTHRVDTRDLSPTDNVLPEDLTHVLILGHAMDVDLVATYPSALAGAATGLEYSREAAIVTQMVTYLRSLGFEAVGSMNDTALVIPYALKAGMGEYGRNQMLITPQFGPRVRFSKIFTNAPLTADQPRPLGIKAYCDICTICATACPPRALPFGAPRSGGENRSALKGVVKWTSNAEKCFGYWARLKTDCAICMRVCPFNRDFRRLTARLFYRIATSPFRRVALWWTAWRGVAPRVKPRHWWARLTATSRP